MTEDISVTEDDSVKTGTGQPQTIWQNRWVLVVGIIVVVPALVLLMLDLDSKHVPVPPQSAEEMLAIEAEMMPDSPSEELDEPGIYNARFYEVKQVVFPDDEYVIGVEVNGHACAYLLAGMNDIDQHIVHHQLGGQEFTVTYCDKSECIAVYDKAGTTAEIRNGGFSGETLWILYDGQRFEQDAEEIPLKIFPSVKTTWAEWKQQHPETLVYVGLGMSHGPTLKDE